MIELAVPEIVEEPSIQFALARKAEFQPIVLPGDCCCASVGPQLDFPDAGEKYVSGRVRFQAGRAGMWIRR